MDVHGVRRLDRPLVKGKAGEVSTIAFHPERHSLCLAVENVVFGVFPPFNC